MTLVSILKAEEKLGTLATDYDSGTNATIISPTENYVIEATSDYSPNTTGGYYLLSISPSNVDFQNDTDNNNHIVGILSRQNQINDFITCYGGESTLTYQNLGEPYLLSEINIQILDPITKQPVVGLGEMSSLFIEIIKPLTGPIMEKPPFRKRAADPKRGVEKDRSKK